MHRSLLITLLAAIVAAGQPAPAAAQIRIGDGLSGLGRGPLGGDAALENPVAVSAQFTAATAERPAVLMITAEMAPGWHVYSITQPPGGPTKTRIQPAPSPQYRLLGEFRAHPEPKSRVDQEAWIGLTLEEHEKQVTWYAPIELAASVGPATVEIRGQVRMLACKESCIPANTDFVARLGDGVPIGPLAFGISSTAEHAEPASAPWPGSAMTQPSTGDYQAEGSEVRVSGRLIPGVTRPQDGATLEITLTPSANWHVYASAPRDDQPGTKPTLIAFDNTSRLIAHRPTTDSPIRTDASVPEFGIMRYHDGAVTWTMRLDVPADARPGDFAISGIVGYQACETRDDGLGSCELPKAVRFETKLTVGDVRESVTRPLTFTPATYTSAAVAAAAWEGEALAADAGSPVAQAPPYDLERVVVQEPGGSLGHFILLAFVGGLILNLMPCVLPVIGLKVMSFVEQAGKSRSHALALNAWYAAGIVSVFLLLGALAVWIGLSWGGQFGNTAFNVTLAAVVFAMALSLLGVWEIPIPGFFGSGSVQSVAAQEGPLGAFLKGVVTTVLATPCTGPFMATAIAWAVMQPATTTLIVFASLGLGMASPYLVVGVFPELLRFLPKPGAWMETFKQVCGWVLVATVVFILTFIEPAAIVPTVLLLVGVGMACWLIAHTPLTAAVNDQLQTWALAAAVVLLFGVVSFGWLYPDVMRARFASTTSSTAGATLTSGDSAWQPFSLERLKQIAVDGGRTVLVDFSAEWCLTCKTLEKTVLHTEPVERAIADSDAVTMYGDFTDYPPEIERTLRALRSNGVPVIAIFPGRRPYEPIVFRGAYTKKSLIAALVEATGDPLNTGRDALVEVSAATPPLN